MRIKCKHSTYAQTLFTYVPSIHSYFIKEGRVCESGTHDQLFAKHGDYFEYVQLQGLDKRE
jgi:ABC-type multidrug transport system fused ATPase/permease subunit